MTDRLDESAIKPDAKYDIFRKMAEYLDPHLILPVLPTLEKMYNPADLAVAKYEIFRKTRMVDSTVAAYRDIHGPDATLPADLEAAQEAGAEEWGARMAGMAKFSELVNLQTGAYTEKTKELVVAGLLKPEYLASSHGITGADIEALHAFAKFRYELGEYEVASPLLALFRALVLEDSEPSLRALWGKFAADILGQRFEEADRERDVLRGAISKVGASAGLSELQILQQRTWLLHWSLYVFALQAFSTAEGRERARDNLIDFFMADVTTIQLNCPWLLRYIVVAVLTSNRKRRSYIRQVARLVVQEAHAYSDPLTQFLESLLVSFDFDEAQAKLSECAAVIASDYFLGFLVGQNEFVDAARRFVFETYCSVNQTVSLGMLATKLHMTEAEVERWVVELLRATNQDAKINSETKTVVFSVPSTSVYFQVIDRTKDLSTRLRSLVEGVETAERDSGAGGNGGEGRGERRRGGDRGDRGDRQ